MTTKKVVSKALISFALGTTSSVWPINWAIYSKRQF
jgi:hypothetical protein